ncbi:ShlB/FhaC/HecB family hemolysin secretion/activation protein [Ralstonia pseudosolanacearum]|uniref:ShlB/FhaC/HecB family hemolysin secretion/activation protein n=1 Tax=Ralstonia pseudosolanacearum TaxID=1310165 RepID=UPI0018A41EF1|nr:ShlB/FhaC/HecB family hemolysin secretion/activation protein [Ralstonia pseudosolanacearum]BCL90911.1 peptide transporter [Ralstonia solanacearum]BCN03475.1 peptide transporter [Ralstonia solanacearum]
MTLKPLTIAAVLLAGAAHAQTPPLEDPAQRALRERQQAERQREATQPAPQIQVAPVVSEPSSVESVVEDGTTFAIHRIELTGNTVLDAATVDQIKQPFLDRELGAKRINLLIRRLTEAFLQRGYVTTRAYLPPQNLKEGTLSIAVVPGKVESLQVNGQTVRTSVPNQPTAGGVQNGGWLTDAGTVWSMPAVGETLKLTDLEQGVDQINRLRRNQAEVQILPGQSPGGSIVALTNQPGDRFRFNIGTDNYGSRATGVTRLRAGVDADNALGFQEALSLSYIGTTDTNAAIASAAVPFGYNTFSYTGSISEYNNLIGDTALVYGRTFAHTFGWNRVIERDAAGRSAFDVTLTHRRTEREVNNLLLDPQYLTVLRVAINGLRKFAVNNQGAYATWEAGFSRGMRTLSASQDAPDITRDEAHSQFWKLDANASTQLPLPQVGNAALAYRGQALAQWSNVALFGSEQIFAGGMSSVRGFREGRISGDRGLTLRNEVVWANAPALWGVRLEPYAFLDGAQTQLVATQHWQYLAGSGVGVRLSKNVGKSAFTSELLLGRALVQPAELGSKPTVLLATLNWTY